MCYSVYDFYIVGNYREDLLAAIPVIRDFLFRELGLRLHPRKVHLTDIRKGVRFLGAVVKPYQRYAFRRGLSRAHSHVYEVLTDEQNSYVSNPCCSHIKAIWDILTDSFRYNHHS